MPCQYAVESCGEDSYWRAVYTTVPGCDWPAKVFCAYHGPVVAWSWAPPLNTGSFCVCGITEVSAVQCGPHPIQLRALERVS